MSEIECIQVFWIHYGQIFRIQVIKCLHSNRGENYLIIYSKKGNTPVLAITFLSFVFIQNSSFIALGIPMFTQNLQKEDVDACKYGFPQILKINSKTIICSNPFM